MTAPHPAWCDPRQCTALPASDLGVQRGGAHRSTAVEVGKDADIGGHHGPLTAQLQQASRPLPTPVTLLLSTGGDPLSLTLDPEQGLGALVLAALGTR